jgi:hypothetical protein
MTLVYAYASYFEKDKLVSKLNVDLQGYFRISNNVTKSYFSEIDFQNMIGYVCSFACRSCRDVRYRFDLENETNFSQP